MKPSRPPRGHTLGGHFMPLWKPGFDFLKLPKFLARKQSALTGRIFPSGRFSLGCTPKKSPIHKCKRGNDEEKSKVLPLPREEFFYCPYGGVDGRTVRGMLRDGAEPENPLGSSKAAISRNRGKRGCRGISAKSRDLICYWVGQLEGKYGRHRLSFLTLTVPSVGEDLRGKIQERWPEIVHRMVDAIKRILRRSGIEADCVFGCTEIQLKRSEKEGWNVPHLHLVFIGSRRANRGWVTTPARIRAIWRRVLFNAVGEFDADFRAAENLQRVRFSAARYLGKYLSKGSSKSLSKTSDGSWHPSDYVVCGRRFRREYRRGTSSGSDVAEYILELARRYTLLKGFWMSPICVKTSIGDQVVGLVGCVPELMRPPDPKVWEGVGYE